MLPAALKPLFVSPLNPPGDKSPQRACQPPCSVQSREREREGGKRGANGDNKPMTAFVRLMCAVVRVSAALLCMHVRKLLRRKQCRVGKFTGEAQESSLT